MALFKKKITEEEASRQFVLAKVQEGKKFWTMTYSTLKDQFGEKAIIQNEDMGVLDLFLAKIALHIQSLKNLFPSEQASRIHKYMLKYVNSPEYGDYAMSEIMEYDRIYNESIKSEENPVDAVAARLLRRWFGANITDFDVELGNKKTGIISPLLVMFATMVITEGSGWKIIKDNFNIVEK